MLNIVASVSNLSVQSFHQSGVTKSRLCCGRALHLAMDLQHYDIVKFYFILEQTSLSSPKETNIAAILETRRNVNVSQTI